MFENTWINRSDYARVLNMRRYSYDDILIIVTNSIILEFLHAQFVHPVFCYSFVFFNTS